QGGGRKEDRELDLPDIGGPQADHQVPWCLGYGGFVRDPGRAGAWSPRAQAHLLDQWLSRQRNWRRGRIWPARDGHRRGTTIFARDLLGDAEGSRSAWGRAGLVCWRAFECRRWLPGVRPLGFGAHLDDCARVRPDRARVRRKLHQRAFLAVRGLLTLSF